MASYASRTRDISLNITQSASETQRLRPMSRLCVSYANRYVTVMYRRRRLCVSCAHCNTLQHTATYCNTRQHAAMYRKRRLCVYYAHCNTLQHTATYCNTLQHTATHCNILQHTATHCYVSKAEALRLLRTLLRLLHDSYAEPKIRDPFSRA